MHTLSAEVHTELARARLKKSRRWAAGLLLAACVLFFASQLLVEQYGWLTYVKVFAGAPMVGALADWFAVTALFRRPTGLPIPHTAILPHDQERIADELGRFIENNFLLGKPIALHVYQAQPADKSLNWLSSEEVRAQWLPWVARQIPYLLRAAKPEQSARFAGMLLAQQYIREKVGRTFSDGLRLLKANGTHEVLFCNLLKQLHHWLQSPDTRVLLEQSLREWVVKIETGAPSTWDELKATLKSTLVERVDDWVAERALDRADNCLVAAEEDGNYAIHKGFDEQYDKIVEKLLESDVRHKQLEAVKMQIVQSPALQSHLAGFWRGIQDWAEKDMEKKNSVCLRQLEKLLDHMLAQTTKSPQFIRRTDVRLSLAVHDFVIRYKGRAAQFVADKVKSWDGVLMVQKLELSVGRDLQFIRIDGMLIGGLVGLAIYCVPLWLE